MKVSYIILPACTFLLSSFLFELCEAQLLGATNCTGGDQHTNLLNLNSTLNNAACLISGLLKTVEPILAFPLRVLGALIGTVLVTLATVLNGLG